MAAQPKERTVAQGIILRFEPGVHLSDEQFFHLCQQNRDLRLERTVEGDIVVMPPAGGRSSDRNADLTMQLRQWALSEGSGVAFDSSGGFILPNGATLSPDAAWVLRSRLARLTNAQKERFLPLCPDFVAELRSPSDALDALHDKLAEYIANGARLGWLIDPDARRVYVYRPDTPRETIDAATHLSGDPVLPGFSLGLSRLWEPAF